MDGTADIGDYARFGFEMGGAPVAGVADFAVDAVNLIPGIDIPGLPKYQNICYWSASAYSLIPNVLIAGCKKRHSRRMQGWVLLQSTC